MDQAPELQGVVTATIAPIDGHVVAERLGLAPKRPKLLHLPTFARPPELIPGTEVLNDDGDPVIGTGSVVPETVEMDAETLAQAGVAALAIIKAASKMEVNELSVDLLAVAYSILHYQNKARG